MYVTELAKATAIAPDTIMSSLFVETAPGNDAYASFDE